MGDSLNLVIDHGGTAGRRLTAQGVLLTLTMTFVGAAQGPAGREHEPCRDETPCATAKEDAPLIESSDHLTTQLAPHLELPARPRLPKQAPGSPAGKPPQHPVPLDTTDYRIGPGDVLQVSVWREPDVSVSSVAVRSDGKISLPLIKEIAVLGLTPRELETALAERFSRFIKSPEVTVIVREIHSEKIYLIGGVVSPGSIELRTKMTVLQALAEAGGLTEFARKKKIYVLRKRGKRQMRLPFDYDGVLKGARPELNFSVEPGDTIVIPD